MQIVTSCEINCLGWVYNYGMNQQSRMLLIIVVVALAVGAVLGASGYYLGSHTALHTTLTMITSTSSQDTADITPISTTSSVFVGGEATSTSMISDSSSTVSVDMSNWKTYSSYELGFSFQYPPDLNIDTSNPSAVTLTFPSAYFSTAMTENSTFTVAVSSTCTPEQSLDANGSSISPQTTTIGGISFSEYNGSIYQGNNNGVCYTIQSTLNGINATDTANIQAIVSDIVSTFAFISTPAGQNESSYSAQSAASSGSNSSTGTGLINLAAVSSSTISIGGSLTLTGSGFLGTVNSGVNNTTIWISNGSVQGALWSGVSSSDTSITTIIPTQACTQNLAGSACPSYLILSPGIYTVSVSNQNGTTDPIYIRIQ